MHLTEGSSCIGLIRTHSVLVMVEAYILPALVLPFSFSPTIELLPVRHSLPLPLTATPSTELYIQQQASELGLYCPSGLALPVGIEGRAVR